MEEILSGRYNRHTLQLFTGKISRMSKLVITLDGTSVHERLIPDLWSPACKYDYFVRLTVVDADNKVWKTSPESSSSADIKMILLSSYEGLFVWDVSLCQIHAFFVPLCDKYEDVFGFDILENELVVWSVNVVNGILESEFQERHGERYTFLKNRYTQIMNGIQQQADRHGGGRDIFLRLWEEHAEFPAVRDELYQLNIIKNRDTYRDGRYVPSVHVLYRIPLW